MLKKQKFTFFFITAYLLVSVLTGLILVLTIGRNDLFPITMIVMTVGLLLYFNIRASYFSRLKYTMIKHKEKISEEMIENHKTATKILFVFFLIMCVISLVTALTIH